MPFRDRGPNALLHICYRWKLFERYKLQKGRLPPETLIKEALVENVLNDVAILPLLAYPLYKLLTCGGRKRKAAARDSAATDGDDDNDDGEGWSRLRFGARLPSWGTMAWQVFGAYLGYDFMFYWTHRLIHQKDLYLKVHKQHHRFRTSIGIASSYQHPVEGAIQMLNWFVPLGVVGWLNGGLHISVVFSYNVLRWIETVDAHCGYSFPWSPFTFIPLFGGALAHDFHHSGEGLQMRKLKDGTLFADFGNYGATVIWDRLMGTESPAYRRLRAAAKKV